MGNPSVRFDEGRERVGHWPVCLSIHPSPPTLLTRIKLWFRAFGYTLNRQPPGPSLKAQTDLALPVSISVNSCPFVVALNCAKRACLAGKPDPSSTPRRAGKKWTEFWQSRDV